MIRKTIAVVLAVLLVIPIAPVLYALLGGGVLGGVACFLLGGVTALVSQGAVNAVAGLYDWYKHRNVYIEPARPLPLPTHTAYELDWTKINEGDKL